MTYASGGFKEGHLSSPTVELNEKGLEMQKKIKDSDLAKPITIDLTQFGGGKYEVKSTPEAIKTFREVLAKAKTQTDANFKSSGGGLSKATEKEYKEALLGGDIDKATYDLLVGTNSPKGAKEYPDTINIKYSVDGKASSFSPVSARQIGTYAIHPNFEGVTPSGEAITSGTKLGLTHSSGMRISTTDEMGDKKTPLKVKKARLEAFANELYKAFPDINADNITDKQRSAMAELRKKANRGDYDPRKDSADLYHVRIPNSILVSRLDACGCNSNRILSYVTDNSGNMMGICQIRGVKYRFLKPIYGATVLTPVSETNLAYLFDLAPDLTLSNSTFGLKKKTVTF
jgi:hypothetical protein